MWQQAGWAGCQAGQAVWSGWPKTAYNIKKRHTFHPVLNHLDWPFVIKDRINNVDDLIFSKTECIFV